MATGFSTPTNPTRTCCSPTYTRTAGTFIRGLVPQARLAPVPPWAPSSTCRCCPARPTRISSPPGRASRNTCVRHVRSSSCSSAGRTASKATRSPTWRSARRRMPGRRRRSAGSPTSLAMVAFSGWAAAGTTAATWPEPGPVWWRPSSQADCARRGGARSAIGYNCRSPDRGVVMFPASQTIAGFDPELAAALDHERTRQGEHIELIASENYASRRVLEAQGSVLTNKYAEGYPGKRYYGGCEFVDIAEQLAIDRAKKLFGADYANVQPHSGSQANAAVYLALINPGDTILGMSLDHGGHLTHGAKVNFSGKIFRAVQYGIRPDNGEIDYDALAAQALAEKPKMVIAGFSAYSRLLDFKRFREIADSVGAYLLVDIAHVAGLVAAGQYPNPVPYADVVTSTTHKTLRGPRGGLILARANEAITKKLNSLVFPGTQGGPLMHVIAAKAVAFLEALQPEFKDYQKQVVVNARAMAARLKARNYRIVCGGTDNHLFLLDLSDKPMNGKE